jgi:AraC-like DNA-binding protein
MPQKYPSQQVRFWRDSRYDYLEARYSRYKTVSFSKHTHDTLSVGVVEQGQCTFYYRGQLLKIGPGEIALIPAGVVHACNPQPNSGWTYRMFYVDPNWLRRLAEESTKSSWDIPNFSTPVVKNPPLFHSLAQLHTTIESQADKLEKESIIYTTFTQLITNFSDRTPRPVKRYQESQSVKLALDYLTDNLTKNISLDELSSLTGFSAYHFLRVFRNTVGLPPHAYQTQLRINQAKKLLADGEDIVQVAYETGFTDQSHFSNKFKRMVGATPRQYKLAQYVNA